MVTVTAKSLGGATSAAAQTHGVSGGGVDDVDVGRAHSRNTPASCRMPLSRCPASSSSGLRRRRTGSRTRGRGGRSRARRNPLSVAPSGRRTGCPAGDERVEGLAAPERAPGATQLVDSEVVELLRRLELLERFAAVGLGEPAGSRPGVRRGLQLDESRGLRATLAENLGSGPRWAGANTSHAGASGSQAGIVSREPMFAVSKLTSGRKRTAQRLEAAGQYFARSEIFSTLGSPSLWGRA
jgi:hypothetical protein